MTEFAVERFNWQRVYGALVRRPGTSTLAVYATGATARALADRHETVARRAINPFAEFSAYFGSNQSGIAYLGRHRNPYSATDMPEAELVEGLRGLGVDPPGGADGARDWAGWYAPASPRWSGERLAAVYGLLPKLRFYRAVERPAAPRVYAVLETRWSWERPPIPARDIQGGELVALHRTRRDAGADATARTAEFVVRQELSYDMPFDMGERPTPGFEFYEQAPQPPRYPGETEPGLVRARNASLYEVHEVPCAPGVDLDSAAELVLATRTGFTMPVVTCPELVADPLVPARLFAGSSMAEAWCDAREAEDRREFPFAWYGELPDSLYNPHGFAEVRGTVEALLDLWALPPVTSNVGSPYLFQYDLRQWRYDHGHRVTPEQNAAVWDECWGAGWRFVSVRHVRLVG